MKICLASRHQKRIQIIDLIKQQCVFDLSFNPSNAPGAVIGDGQGGIHFITCQKIYHLDSNQIENMNTNSPKIRLSRLLGRILIKLGYSPSQLDSFPHQLKKRRINGKVDYIFAATQADSIKNQLGQLIYKPSFVTTNRSDDQFHLNGLEVVKGKNKSRLLVTCLATVTPWRDNFDLGRLWYADVEDSFVSVLLPHSPVFYQDRIYVLESGKSRLLSFNSDLEQESKRVEADGFPGFVRGLAIDCGKAIVATSRLKKNSSFYEVAKDYTFMNGDECSIWEVDLKTSTKHKAHEFKNLRTIADICIL